MNVDELLRDSLREQAAEEPPMGPGFADQVLAVGRRRRIRALASVAACTAAVVALAIGVPRLDSAGHDAPVQHSGKNDVSLPRLRQFDVPLPPSLDDGLPLASETDKRDVIAHPDQSPPRNLIAAGDTALAAYSTSSVVEESPDKGLLQRTYWILNQKTGKYEKDARWSFLAVAPGMRTAAVLERHLPASRIGVYDLVSRQVVDWIPVDRGVASVAYSPDGSRILATTYDTQPDGRLRAPDDADGDGKKNDWYSKPDKALATGFYILDLKAGKGAWNPVTIYAKGVDPRVDFVFNTDGTLVSPDLWSASHVQFYNFKGEKVATPAKDKYLRQSPGPGLSPNGKLLAGYINEDEGSATNILDPYTGKRLYKTPGVDHLAWADDKRLIVGETTPGTLRFQTRLALVTIGDDTMIPLSGSTGGRESSSENWAPIFARR